VHCIKSLSFVVLENLQVSVIVLFTLGGCCLIDGLEKVKPLSPSRRLWRSSGLVVRGSCAHLAGVVKSNSSGIEVLRGS
jgi:hypothetical protein